MSDGFNQNYQSLNGLYNLNCDDLVCDTLEFNYLDNIPETFFDDIKSNVQSQIDAIITSMNQSTISGQITTINNQITSINTQLTTFNNQLTTINTNETSLTASINSINYQISSINTSISNANTNISSLQTKTTELNYSNSKSSFSNGLKLNNSNTATNNKVLTLYDDSTNFVSIGCQYSGTNLTFTSSNATYGGIQFYIGTQLLMSFSPTAMYVGLPINGISMTTFNYLLNVSSDIQTQINSLQSQINTANTNITNNLLSNIGIGTVTTLTAGSSAVVTYNTSTHLFNFSIPKGDIGATGPKGDKGNNGSDASVTLSLLNTLLGVADIAATVGAVAVMQSQITGINAAIASLQGQIDAIQTSISTLQSKTQYLTTSTSTLTSRFTSQLKINDGTTDNAIITQSGNLTCNTINSSGITSSGNFTNGTNTLTTGSITSSGNLTNTGILNLGTTLTGTHNINGAVININCALINLNGFVSTGTSFFSQW